MHGWIEGTVAGFEFRDATFQRAVVFCLACPPACLLDLWHCGVLVRNPSPTALPCHHCKLFPPSFLIKRKKHHNATKRDLMRLRGLVFWWCCGVPMEAGCDDMEATELKTEAGSEVPSVTF